MASTQRRQTLEFWNVRNELASSRALRNVALVLLVGFLLHNGDHLRRGIGAVTDEVLWAGSVSGVITLVAIALVLAGNRLGPPSAVAVGFGMAIGVSVVHLLPRWSALSDSLPDGNVDAFTWIAVSCEIVAAFAFGGAGVLAMRIRPQFGT